MNDKLLPPLVIERVMPHPVERVWRALTQASFIEEWLMTNDFKPEVGHKFNFQAEPNKHWNGVTDCEVLEIEPHKLLSYTWNSSGEEAANGLKTVVTFTLTPVANGVLLRMEQSGFRSDQQANHQGANYGWQKFLGQLEKVLASLD
jgi:uncharacterized protein YndB with AHSA1/START domain